MAYYWDFVAAIVDSIAWPAVAVLAIWMLRKPLSGLLSVIEELQYKDIAVRFQRDAEQARQAVPLAERDDERVVSLPPSADPRSAVLEAWLSIEKTAVEKYRELANRSEEGKIEPGRAVAYFEYTGALTPTTQRALTDLRDLRSQAAHSRREGITREAAEAYVDAAASIRKQIEAMSSTPAVQLLYLTLLILHYNSLIDSGKYDDITISDVHEHIETGTVLRFITERAGTDVDLSLHFSAKAADQSFEQYYARYLRAIFYGSAGNERRKWGVEKRGLCLLVAWTNEIIQAGGGWYPTEDVAGLHD
ncbi:MAG: hypothetical protein OXP28_05680 [Gammaproteobacteria bacterium]|nr:hypothetical protein [Gammaproteobacteria bacterium]MDE0224607.1 hypothetical protein [Gammaproteobacteria bacterium]